MKTTGSDASVKSAGVPTPWPTTLSGSKDFNQCNELKVEREKGLNVQTVPTVQTAEWPNTNAPSAGATGFLSWESFPAEANSDPSGPSGPSDPSKITWPPLGNDSVMEPAAASASCLPHDEATEDRHQLLVRSISFVSLLLVKL